MTRMVALVNQSQHVTLTDLSKMVSAINLQLNTAAQEHHKEPVQLFQAATVPSAGAFALLKDQPDVDGALGYHDEDGKARVYSEIFVAPVLDNGGGILSGELAVSSVLSHEMLEMLGDWNANRWVNYPNGRTNMAEELCDPVQNFSYVMGGVSLSDYVLPSYFDPHGKAPFSKMNKPKAPFTITSGGYAIIETANSERQIQAEGVPDWFYAFKGKQPGTRSYRRLVEDAL